MRDTREFTFVFTAIVTGVGIGGGQFFLTAGGCLFVLVLLVVLERVKFYAARAVAACKGDRYRRRIQRIRTRPQRRRGTRGFSIAAQHAGPRHHLRL